MIIDPLEPNVLSEEQPKMSGAFRAVHLGRLNRLYSHRLDSFHLEVINLTIS
jgi:hypothetical protein